MVYKKLITLILLCIILIVGFYLRILPFFNTSGRVHFKYDQAFHVRMALEVFERGKVSTLDRLSLHPDGRNLSKQLPTVLYYAGAYFNKLVGLFQKGTTPLNTIICFCAIVGTLIGVPVYFIGLVLLGDKKYALFSSLLAVVLLPYLVRTLCYWFRYDGVGALLLFSSFAFFLYSLTAKRTMTNILYAALSGGVLILALATWRIALVFFVIHLLSIVVILLMGMKTANIKRSYAITAAMGASSFLFVPYLATGNLHRYGGIVHTAFLKIMNLLTGNVALGGFDQLLFNIEELQTMPILTLLSPERFFLAGLFPLIFIGYLIRQNKTIATDKEKRAIHSICIFFIVMFFALTLLFRRFQVLFAPFVALSTSALLQASIRSQAARKKGIANLVFVAVILLTCVQLVHTSYRYASHLGSVFDRPTAESLKWINANTSEGSAILTYWADGYVVQLYTGRPTITDGLLEDRENKKRIIETGKALYATDEKALYRLCKQYDCEYMLLPTNQTKGYAMAAGVNYADYFTSPGRPTRKGRNITLFKLLTTPKKSTYFTLKHRNKKYLLFKVLS